VEKENSAFLFFFYCGLGGNCHPADHQSLDSAPQLVRRLLSSRLTDDLVADAVGHVGSCPASNVCLHILKVVHCGFPHKPLARGALLDEEELLLGVVEEEEDVHKLRSLCLCGADCRLSRSLGALYDIVNELFAVITKALAHRIQVLMDPPRDSNGAIEWVTISGAVDNILVKDLVVGLGLMGADSRNDRPDDWAGCRDGSHDSQSQGADCRGCGEGHFRILYEDIAVCVLVMRTITLIRAYSVQFYP